MPESPWPDSIWAKWLVANHRESVNKHLFGPWRCAGGGREVAWICVPGSGPFLQSVHAVDKIELAKQRPAPEQSSRRVLTGSTRPHQAANLEEILPPPDQG
jgi:hypothetical protein